MFTLDWAAVKDWPLETYNQMLQKGQPFAFSRWGDGEWRSITGAKPTDRNCDGHHYLPAMGLELRRVICSRPSYFLGLQHFAVQIYPDRINPFLERNQLTDLTWHNADIFHNAIVQSPPQAWLDFLKHCRSRPLLVLGPEHLRQPLQDLLGVSPERFIAVQRMNCYLQLPELLQRAGEYLAKATEPHIVSLSCSMPAEIILDRLYRDFGHRDTILDTGSVWDVYGGCHSRKYTRRLKETGWRPPVLPPAEQVC